MKLWAWFKNLFKKEENVGGFVYLRDIEGREHTIPIQGDPRVFLKTFVKELNKLKKEKVENESKPDYCG